MSGLLILYGSAHAQSQGLHPQTQIAGEPNGAAQSQPVAPSPSLAEKIRQVEMQVQSEPENAEARATLVGIYLLTLQFDKGMEQLLWVVEHHPEWRAAGMTAIVWPEGGHGFTVADYQRLKAAWERALTDHSDDSEVLCYGGLFLESSDGERALQLFHQARQLQPSSSIYAEAIAGIYIEAAAHGANGQAPIALPADLAARLRDELPTSNDPELLYGVGSQLARIDPQSPDNAHRQLGLRLLERATLLEPDNPRWAKALAIAKAYTIPGLAKVPNATTPAAAKEPSTLQMNVPPAAVHIDGFVAEGNLVRRVAPIYPPLARAAGVSGSVEFTGIIGTDGHIQNLQLVRGHPLLIQAARDAVLQWEYKPMLRNGSPVPVVTNILIQFKLTP